MGARCGGYIDCDVGANLIGDVMRMRTSVIGVMLAIGVGVAGAGCFGGGGGGLTLEEYFAEYERLDNAAESRTEQLQNEYAGVLSATTLDEATRTGLKEYFEKQVAARREYLNGIDDLKPPDKATAAHDESVTAYEAVLAAFEPVVVDLETASTISDLDRIFSGQALTDAIARSDESCRTLQALADDNDINANLECAVAGS